MFNATGSRTEEQIFEAQTNTQLVDKNLKQAKNTGIPASKRVAALDTTMSTLENNYEGFDFSTYAEDALCLYHASFKGDAFVGEAGMDELKALVEKLEKEMKRREESGKEMMAREEMVIEDPKRSAMRYSIIEAEPRD
ncbi:hypothetical protein CCM_05097 [Cordyceps militaris CM01]|uniref:Uncharacterized protein n=1 Tax=Cordyceps militaris (strain CM01) TaxID=983644 RepID=G3JHT5_CORMM|nr:uncharacterized protein CCM_05097 [Cordyceps militaris CM01]EGX90941.1 hypothetical protein CCM_05097 [Cordyceps militaris CM01]